MTQIWLTKSITALWFCSIRLWVCSALVEIIIQCIGLCVCVCVSTGLSAEQSTGCVGCSCSPSAARDHPFFHQADLSETRQGNTHMQVNKHIDNDPSYSQCSVATVTYPCLPAEHHPGLEEELWDCQADHRIPSLLPSTGCDGWRE